MVLYMRYVNTLFGFLNVQTITFMQKHNTENLKRTKTFLSICLLLTLFRVDSMYVLVVHFNNTYKRLKICFFFTISQITNF